MFQLNQNKPKKERKKKVFSWLQVNNYIVIEKY